MGFQLLFYYYWTTGLLTCPGDQPKIVTKSLSSNSYSTGRLFQSFIILGKKLYLYELVLTEGVKWMVTMCRIGGGGEVWRNLQD